MPNIWPEEIQYGAIKNESWIFLTSLSVILVLWSSEKMTHAKFEENRIIFRGGAGDLKFAHVYVLGVEVSIPSS